MDGWVCTGQAKSDCLGEEFGPLRVFFCPGESLRGELLRGAMGVRPVKGFLGYSRVVTNGLKFPSFILETIRLTRCLQRNSLKGNAVLPSRRLRVPCGCRGVGCPAAPRRRRALRGHRFLALY